MYSLKLISVPYENIPSAIVKKISLTTQNISDFYQCLKEVLGINEVFVISTQTYSAVYIVGEVETEIVIKLWCSLKGLHSDEFQILFTKELNTQKAMEHFFKMAVDLNSDGLPRDASMTTIKTFYRLCCETGFAKAFLHRLLHTVFALQKPLSAYEKGEMEKEELQNIVQDTFQQLKDWTRIELLESSLQKFQVILEDIRVQEMQRYCKKLNKNEQFILEAISKRFMEKVGRLPLNNLQNSCLRDENPTKISQKLLGIFTVKSVEHQKK